MNRFALAFVLLAASYPAFASEFFDASGRRLKSAEGSAFSLERRPGRLPVVEVAGRTFDWPDSRETRFATTVCAAGAERPSLRLRPASPPTELTPISAELFAEAPIDRDGSATLTLPAGRYVAGLDLMIEPESFELPGPVPTLAVVPARSSMVHLTVGGGAAEGCRTVVAVRSTARDRGCSLERSSLFLGAAGPIVFPADGEVDVRALCAEALPRSVTLHASAVSDHFALDLPRAAKLEGRIHEPSGAPVTGLALLLYLGDDALPLGSTKTDSSGRFRFPRLRPAHYRIVDGSRRDEPAERFLPAKTDSASFEIGTDAFHAVAVPTPHDRLVDRSGELAGGRTETLDIELPAIATWAGRVLDDAGVPISEARVVLASESTKSDGDGRFTLETRRTDLSTVGVEKDGYASEDIAIHSLADAPSVVTLSRFAKLRVSADADVADLRPRFFDESANPVEPNTWMSNANDEGQKIEVWLPPGRYVLEATALGRRPLRSDPFVLVAGQEFEYGRLRMEADPNAPPPPDQPKREPSKPIRLRVVDRSGQPAVGVGVFVSFAEGSEGGAGGRTDESGALRIESTASAGRAPKGTKGRLVRLVSASGDAGWYFAEGAQAAKLFEDPLPTLKLSPPNSLRITHRHLEPDRPVLVRVEAPNGIEQRELAPGASFESRNDASPVRIRVFSTSAEELFETEVTVPEGSTKLEL